MTLANFQAAVAKIIRVHPGVRPAHWLDQFENLELSEAERASLALLVADSEVSLYGREQAEHRWTSTVGKLFRLRHVLDVELLYDFWEKQFDHQYPSLETDQSSERASYTLAFIDALAAHPPAGLDEELRDVFSDLLALERAEVEMSQADIVEWPVQPGGPLAHGAWRMFDVEHDVVQWFEDWTVAKTAGEANLPKARPGRMTLLVVRAEGLKGVPRIFEVDDDMRCFLLGQSGKGPLCEATPEILADLEVLELKASHPATH